MSELPAITTAPAPGRKHIQIYTKLSTKTISLGFWDAEVKTKRQHDIDSSATATNTLTTTTAKSQIANVEFYGATAVLGFVVTQRNGKHSLAFLSPAFKLLTPPEKTTTFAIHAGLAGLSIPGPQGGSYLYFMSPASVPPTTMIREYSLDDDDVTDISAAIAPSEASPLAAYYHPGGSANPPGEGRYVVYILHSSIREAIVSNQGVPVPHDIVTGTGTFDPTTGLAVVHNTANKFTYLYYVGPRNELMRTLKEPNNMTWMTPVQITNANPTTVKPGAQLTAVLQKDNIHIFWPLSEDSNALGHGFDDLV